ncbi:MAG TPA: hypothetical protein VK730_00445 [Solirubrobacteraceae bacterium]|nr:hypothetical protein [Solirubrobacteraceae bacterium]
MRLRLLPTTGSVLVLALGALAGCGSSSSSNNIASKSATEILTESKAAADSASSVHVSGSIKTGATPVTIDLSLAAGKGARGEISENGASFKLILVGGTAYISGSPAFYRSLGGAAAAQLLDGKWLKASATSGEFASFNSLGNMRQLIDTTLAAHGTLTKGATSTVNGQQVIAVTDTNKTGTLYVATSGKPYPVAITKGGSENGRIVFSDWNQPVTITAPANAVDLSELKALAGH